MDGWYKMSTNIMEDPHTITSYQDFLATELFYAQRTDHQSIRTHLGHDLFHRKQEAFLQNTQDHEQLQLRRCHSGDCNKNSDDDKSKSTCFKQKPIQNLSKDYFYPEKRLLEKVKGVNRRKCGETPEELRKCLKTLQDVVDFVHPIMPYVS